MIDKYKQFRKMLKDNDYYNCPVQQDFDLYKDCYSIEDNRYWTSNVRDIRGGDNFADYCKYIFKLYEDEEIDYY